MVFFALFLAGGIIFYFMFKNLIKQSKEPSGKVGIWMMKLWNRAYIPMVKWSLRFAAVKLPKNILDVGVGNGASTNLIQKHFSGSLVYGIDCSETAIDEARRSFSSPLVFEKMSIEAAAFPPAFFDLIFAFQTHFHWEQLDQAMSEMRRILAPEGEIIIACERSKVNYYLPDFTDIEYFQAYLNKLGLKLVQTAQTQRWICYRIIKQKE